MEGMDQAVQHVRDGWVPAAWTMAWKILGQDVVALTSTLREVIPSWNVYVTAKKYNATLAKKHLLDEGIVERLMRC